ncbi:MAG TPA: FAD-dependent oxidoreductase [Candidatus Atribacteria bacterium]|nr:FAD-dependent oxidoreductase [Candidatus Atribacteria bacterium]
MRTLNQVVDEIVNTDVLVIGSGVTGMRAAIEAAQKGVTVTLVNKGYFGKSGSSLVADAGIAIDSASAVSLFNLPALYHN